MLFGASGYGIPLALLQDVNSGMASATGIGGVTGCVTTKIAMVYGMRYHPHVTYATQLLVDFYGLWAQSNAEEQNDLIQQWVRFRLWAHSP